MIGENHSSLWATGDPSPRPLGVTIQGTVDNGRSHGAAC